MSWTSQQRAGIAEGMAVSAYSALTSAFVAAFALSLGADKNFVALLTALPAAMQFLFYLPAATLAERTGQPSRIATISAFLSRGAWFILVPLPFLFPNLSVILAVVTLSALIGTFTGPAWSALIGKAVPSSIRGRYFGFRNRLAAMASLLAAIVGGVVLGALNNPVGFALIFGLGTAAGLLSATFFPKIGRGYKFPAKKTKYDFKKVASDIAFKRFCLLFCVLRIAVMIPTPFQVIILLQELKIGYFWFAALGAIGTLAGMLVLPAAGMIADRAGHRNVLVFAAFLSIGIATTWVFATEIWQLIFLFVLNGMMWAIFDLCAFNYVLELAPTRLRPTYTSIFWMIQAGAAIVGPMIGSWLAGVFAPNPPIGTEFRTLYAISAFMRLFVAVGMLHLVATRKRLLVHLGQEIFTTVVNESRTEIVHFAQATTARFKMQLERTTKLFKEYDAARLAAETVEIETEAARALRRRTRLRIILRRNLAKLQKLAKKYHAERNIQYLKLIKKIGKR
jgi:MFS family permease